MEPVPILKRDFGITKLAPDGIIQRKINATRLDNSVSVKYEDDDMDLEHESKFQTLAFYELRSGCFYAVIV